MSNIFSNRLGQVLRTSQTLLNSKFPDEFELYMCSLELVSTKTGKTLSYFIFPIMPSSIDFTQQTLTNVMNTLGGVSVLSTTNFVPFDISLLGNFGRGFRVSLGNSFSEITSIVSNLNTIPKLSQLKETFDPKLKSGYGYCKILESIINESQNIDDDGQRILYFYNPSFNQKFVVEPVSLNYKQDLGSNMVWNYSLVIKAVAPLSLVSTFKLDGTDLGSTLSKDYILKNISSKILGVVKSLL